MLTDAQVYCMTSMIYLFRPSLTAKAIYRKTAEAKLQTPNLTPVSRVVKPTLSSLEEFQERDSGWALSRIPNLTMNMNKHNPLRAGSYQTPARNYAKESDNQYVNRRQWVFRMICYCRSTCDSRKCTLRIFVSSLLSVLNLAGVESKYRPVLINGARGERGARGIFVVAREKAAWRKFSIAGIALSKQY